MSYQYPRSVRPPMTRLTMIILAVNGGVFLVELLLAYAVHFDPIRVSSGLKILGLSWRGVLHGHLWQPLTYMWVHSPDNILHIGFNLLVLYFFGPSVEMRLSSRRFGWHYLAYGLGGGLLFVLSDVFSTLVLDHPFGPAIGASGAIAGVITVYCLMHWRDRLSFFFLQLSGRSLLIAFLVIDLVRLLYGEAIAVQAHWGGMITAWLLFQRPSLDLGRLKLRWRRWRLSRRLRLERTDGSSPDDRILN